LLVSLSSVDKNFPFFFFFEEFQVNNFRRVENLEFVIGDKLR
jgi:hypothetical protein